MLLKKYKILFLSLLIFQETQIFPQHDIHFIVSVPPNTNEVYIAAAFNNWNPADGNYKLSAVNGYKKIVIRNLSAGEYQFKFTQGAWQNSECNAAGIGIENRHLIIRGDTTVHLTIEGWLNEYFDLSHLPDSVLNEAMMARAGYYLDVNLDSSYKYAVQLFKISQRLRSEIYEARALDLQSVVFTRQGNGQNSLESLFKSLEIKKRLKDSSGVSFTYNAIGAIYESIQDYERAKEIYQNAVEWTEKKFEYYESVGLINIGNIFLKNGQPDSALHYAEKALKFDSLAFGSWLLMGNIYSKANKLQLSMQYYKKATQQGIPFPVIAEAYKNISNIFEANNQYDSAFYYAKNAYTLAATVKDPNTIISAGSSLSKLFKDAKRFDSAFFYQDIVLKAKDSLFTQEKERQIHNIYFNEKLRQQETDARNEKYHSQIKVYILTGVSVLLILMALVYRIRMRSKFDKQLSNIEMRALRAQMNPHFIFNCLASINRYIVKSDIKTASGYLTKFSKLIRLILDNSSNEFISVEAEIQTLKLYLDMESLRFDNSFDYEIYSDSIERPDSTAIPTMIVQPYIENAIWHGLLHKEQKGKVWIRFIQKNNDIIQIEIEDNGIGRKKAAELRSKDTIKTNSYGMQISKDRIRLVNSQLNIQSSVIIDDLSDDLGNALGTKITLQLPLIEIAAALVTKII